MAEQKKPSQPRKKEAQKQSEPVNKYAPPKKIRPTIGASRVGQPNAGRVTAANLNQIKVTVH